MVLETIPFILMLFQISDFGGWEGLKYFIQKYPPNCLVGGYNPPSPNYSVGVIKKYPRFGMNDNPPNYMVGGYTPPPNYLVGAKKIPPVLVWMIKKYPPNYLVGGYKKKTKSFGGGHKKYPPPPKKVVSCCLCGRQVCMGHKKTNRVSGLKKTPEVMTIYGTQKTPRVSGVFCPFFFRG